MFLNVRRSRGDFSAMHQPVTETTLLGNYLIFTALEPQKRAVRILLECFLVEAKLFSSSLTDQCEWALR